MGDYFVCTKHDVWKAGTCLFGDLRYPGKPLKINISNEYVIQLFS